MHVAERNYIWIWGFQYHGKTCFTIKRTPGLKHFARGTVHMWKYARFGTPGHLIPFRTQQNMDPRGRGLLGKEFLYLNFFIKTTKGFSNCTMQRKHMIQYYSNLSTNAVCQKSQKKPLTADPINTRKGVILHNLLK